MILKKHLNIKLKTKHMLEKIKNYRKDTLKNLNMEHERKSYLLKICIEICMFKKQMQY